MVYGQKSTTWEKKGGPVGQTLIARRDERAIKAVIGIPPAHAMMAAKMHMTRASGLEP